MIVDYTIRPESDTDYDGIREVHERAFERNDEAQAVDAMRQQDAFVAELSLVAVTDSGQVIGHVLFMPVNVSGDEGTHESLALTLVAVDPAHQRQRVGSTLVRKGLVRAESSGYRHVIVLGHTEYFARFGFKSAQDRDIRAPFPVPDETFMVIELVEGGLQGVRGVVKYPEPFNALHND